MPLPPTGPLLLFPDALRLGEEHLLRSTAGRPLSFLPAAEIPEALRRGEAVCVIPQVHSFIEGAAAPLLGLAIKENVPLVPVWLENTGGRAGAWWGQPIEPAAISRDSVRKALYDLREHAFQSNPVFASHLGYEALRGLQAKFSEDVFIDGFQNGRSLTGGKLLAASLGFAKWLKANVPEKRVGVVLPAGLGGAIGNLACVLADKTPVNLNFTAGDAAIRSAIERSGIRTIVTAGPVIAKLKDFPWTANRIDIVEVLPKLKLSIGSWLALAKVLPAPALAFLAGVPRSGDRAEAALLFTSGSAGDPKGVVLSHRNILGNTRQISLALGKAKLSTMLGCLPIFHSFGFTVSFWWPVMGGPKTITYPTPMETSKLADLIEKYKIELFVNTPTFLRAYLRKAKKEQLASVRMVVTGAEKLPPDLCRDFESAFGVQVFEGYGMTEATPVIGVNLLDKNSAGLSNRRVGSIGRLMPGLNVRIRHPETDHELPLTETGMIWFRGANVFDGYLNDPARTADVLKDGWYRTGDIGHVDEEGFLFIDGRMSRFSKIAGEMVPHGTVEQKILEALDSFPEDTVSLVVVGVPSLDRGEELVIVTTRDIDMAVLRPKLASLGLPNLWIPKRVRKVEVIPLFATGKLDLRSCATLAAASYGD